MAISFTRSYVCKSMKCLATVVIIAFLSQVILALYFIPSDRNVMANINDMISSKMKLGDSSAAKLKAGFEDDEEYSKNSKAAKPSLVLRLEELEFTPDCHIHSKEAISAIHRAKSQECKRLISDITCEIQDGTFYPEKLPNSCPNKGYTYGKYWGCYQDEKKVRILSSFYGNYPNTNSPELCINICIQAGFPYAGVQYVSECFCGDSLPLPSSKLKESHCDMKCPGDHPKTCGGYFTMNIYETGLKKFEPQIPRVPKESHAMEPKVRIVFLLTLNGRALRQVYRLINALYSTQHYFFIHVDERQDYLHRKLLHLEQQFHNIKLARRRFATIWGGASLLQMLLASMREFTVLGWRWDFVINLSESDFPIKSLKSLENFLSLNKGFNFVKSHGREVQRFIKKQGLDRTFVECDTHMWRIGERKLPKGIVIDGGSDWIALSSEFVDYVTGTSDPLITGLLTVFEHTLLPAESFFHTVLRNSKFCSTYVDNNLHVTNWKRKLGCKCQYKHVVDWCGCSPNDFTVEDWPRIQNTQDRQLYFARKFEPIINQEVITRVEKWIGFDDHHLIGNLEAYWQSIFDWRDRGASSEDLLRTHAASVLRHNARILLEGECFITPEDILQIHSFSEADVYKGNLILHTALVNESVQIVLETWYKPHNKVVLDSNIKNSENVKVFKVSSDYDQKESTFRNLANILGPLSEPVLLLQLSAPFDKSKENFTTVWVDPTGAIADINQVYIDEHNLTSFVKPSLKIPVLPGVWSVGLVSKSSDIIAQTKFLISPIQFYGGKELTQQDAETVHSGSQRSYNKFSNFKLTNFIPSQEESLLLNELSKSNNKKLDTELSEWIDSLTYMFYNLLGTCVSGLRKGETMTCGQHVLQECQDASWSSKFPDPKGQIGTINEQTGRLDRI